MLTDFENFSITRELTGYLNNLNNNDTVEGYFFSRAIGLVAIPFSCLADAAVHISLFAIKILVGGAVSVFNSMAHAFYPDCQVSREYELSSCTIHFFRIFESLLKATILPVIGVLNPGRANSLVHVSEIQPTIGV